MYINNGGGSLMPKQNPTPFRAWLNLIWQEHRTEIYDWEGKVVEYDLSEWIKRNKWFLKSLWKKQQ